MSAPLVPPGTSNAASSPHPAQNGSNTTRVASSAPLSNGGASLLAATIPLAAGIAGAIPLSAAIPLAAAAVAVPHIIVGTADAFTQQRSVRKTSKCHNCKKQGFVYGDTFAHGAEERLPMCKPCWQHAVFDPHCLTQQRRTKCAGIRAGALDPNDRRPYADVCCGCDKWFMNHPWLGDEDGYCVQCINNDMGF